MRKHTQNLFAVFLLGMLPQAAHLSEPSADDAIPSATTVPLDVFEGPKGIELAQPAYPKSKQRVGAEGWVNVSLMVDPTGNPYEITVSDSTGTEAFERAAVRAIENSTFQPATLNGQPIDAGHHLKVKFELEGGQPGARPRFISVYQTLNTAIRDQDREEAEAQLEELSALSIHNLYEDAYLNLGRYTYYQRWGTREQQLNALTRAIAHEKKEGYLPSTLFKSALLTSFRLQVALQDFGGAMKTWAKLKDLDLDAEQHASGQRVMDQLLILKDDERAYSVTGMVGPNASWFYSLFKRNFSIEVTEGELAEFKLRCDRSYTFSRYDPKLLYRIAPGDGNCHLEVVGNPGTRFILTQS